MSLRVESIKVNESLRIKSSYILTYFCLFGYSRILRKLWWGGVTCSTRRVLPYCLNLYVCIFVLLLLSGAFAELRKASISLDMSFLLTAWNNSAASGRIYDIW